MSVLKTKPTKVSVESHIAALANAEQRNDAQRLMVLMRKVTKQEPRMWGPSIVGFGSYHYKYPSGHEGDSALAAFAVREGNWLFTSRRASKAGTPCLLSWESTDRKGICLHWAPGQRRSEGSGEVGSPVGRSDEDPLSAEPVKFGRIHNPFARRVK
jgi:hypothetical protein